MNDWQAATEPVVEEFGPCRAIGLNHLGKNEQGEIPALWDSQFIPRMGEIATPGPGAVALGLCRCRPGVTDGSFEYIAALQAADDAQVPEGMLEVTIPRCRYVVVPVRNLSEIHQAWDYSHRLFADHPEWVGYCGPQGCDCATHPCFELYPPDFCGDGPLYLYFPIHG